jgi:hypothetical protein
VSVIDDETPSAAPGPTELAAKLSRLRDVALKAAEARTRLPVPLFWSLFHSQVRDVRKVRDRERKLRALFLNGE